jgi:protein-disulfide isomerase
MIADFLFNDPNSPRIGAKNPKLTLVVFTDYNCPYCKKFDPYLEKIVEKHPDVAVVFKFLPFRSESSLTAARDALTLWRQEPGQFMKLNHTLMAKKGYHDDASIQEAQKRAGVSVTTPDDESMLTIKRSLIVAEKMGIQGTPATLIGEGLLPGWVPFEQFDEMVSDALKNR